MTLTSCEDKDWLHQEHTSKDDILACLRDAESDIADARRDMASAWSFSLACSAALNLCAALLHASGHRGEDLSHRQAVNALPMIFGEHRKKDADYLASCLQLRSQKKLQDAHSIVSQQATELLHFTEDLYQQVTDWLRSWDPRLLVNSDTSLQHDSDWLTSL